MKNKLLAGLVISLVACLGLNDLGKAQDTLLEIDDAGDLVSTAQSITTSVSSISGNILDGATADLYGFSWEGGLFQVATDTSFDSTAEMDTMLWVFDEFGSFIWSNDDHVMNSNSGSYISISLAAGKYFIGISGWPNEALNDAGEGFRFDGATGPLAGWGAAGEQVGWDIGGYKGAYTIGFGSNISPFDSIAEPEPVPELETFCEGLKVDAVGIALTRNWEEDNDGAQFIMSSVAGIQDAANNAVAYGIPLTLHFGACDSPIYSFSIDTSDLDVTDRNLRYTVGNVDVVRCVFSSEQCLVNVSNVDLDNVLFGDLLPGEMTVSLEVGDINYTNTGIWKQYNSGNGSWTKYRKDK